MTKRGAVMYNITEKALYESRATSLLSNEYSTLLAAARANYEKSVQEDNRSDEEHGFLLNGGMYDITYSDFKVLFKSVYTSGIDE